VTKRRQSTARERGEDTRKRRIVLPFLPRESRLQQAAKIIDEHRGDKGERGDCKDNCANMLDWLEWMDKGDNAFGRVSSGKEVKAEKRVATWLRRGVILLRNLYGWPPGFEKFMADVGRWAKLYKPGKAREPTPTILAKRWAAEAALHLCDEFEIEPTKTRNGSFCRLAAVLYGNKGYDLQKHCIAVLAPDYSTRLARTKDTNKDKDRIQLRDKPIPLDLTDLKRIGGANPLQK
jgi:hypothetical protein